MTYIQQSEHKLKEIQQTPSKSKVDETIKQNVEIIIGQKLRDLMHSVKRCQRDYMAKVSELNGI